MREIHFWDFKWNTCIRIEKKYMENIINTIFTFPDYHYKIAERMKVDESILNDIRRNPSKKIEINTLMKLIKFLRNNRHKISLSDFESHIIWIGSHTGRGLTRPKLSFRTKNVDFVRILSASFGDGTITNINYSDPKKYKLGIFEYTNNNKMLIDQLLKSAIKVFGGNYSEYTIRPNRNTFSLYFPSIIRDLLLMSEGLQGEKSIYNPSVPSFIMNSATKNLWIAWLKQTFDDEGSVRFRDNFNHEIHITRVTDVTRKFAKKFKSQIIIPFRQLSNEEQKIIIGYKVKLLVGELKLLNKLGIKGKLKPQEIYTTKNNRIKAKWRLYITRKENLKKFARIIGFTDLTKRNILEKIIGEKIAI